MRRTLALLLVGTAAVASTSPAFAQDAREGYAPVPVVVGEIQSEEPQQPARGGSTPSQPAQPTAAPPASQPQVSQGALPFTGADLGIVAGLGILLIVAGLAVRRVRLQQE